MINLKNYFIYNKNNRRNRLAKKKINNFELFDFQYDKIIGFCNDIKEENEKIIYLEYVLKEYKNNKSIFDLELYDIPLDKRIKNEINYLKAKNELTNPNVTKNTPKLVWQKNRQDFAALFDLLFQLGFLTYERNKWEALSNHFTWSDGEMTGEQLRHALNNTKNKSETHQLSDEINGLIECLKKI